LVEFYQRLWVKDHEYCLSLFIQPSLIFLYFVFKAKYENREITYTISFDQEMKLAGLYLK